MGESGNSPPHTPPDSPRIEQEKPPSPPQVLVMATIDGVGGVFVSARFPWIKQDVVTVPRVHQDKPKIPNKFLSKFDLDLKEDTPKDHTNKFMLSLDLMNV